jgi:hypothetical protein
MAETESQKEMDNIKKLEDYVTSLIDKLGVVPSAGVEGNYTTWALQWNVSETTLYAISVITYNDIIDKMLIFDDGKGVFEIRKLSDGMLYSSMNAENFNQYNVIHRLSSAKGGYLAFTTYVGGVIYLNVYKNCVLVMQINLTTVLGWAGDNYYCCTTISADGKYILVVNAKSDVRKVALFKGS